MRQILVAALLAGLATLTAGAQAPDVPTFAGVRELRAAYLPYPFINAWVAATDEGLVQLSFDERVHGRNPSREPHATREVFRPDHVLQWAKEFTDIAAALAAADPPLGDHSASLGYPFGVAFEAHVAYLPGTKPSYYFLTRNCGNATSHVDVDPVAMAGVVAQFRRVAQQATSITPRAMPDNPIWYEHAVSCPATASGQNLAPAWPAGARLQQPHQELVEFVVDAAGRIEPGSERFLASGQPLFTDAIRAMLPRWQFTPARRAGQPVRQLAHVNVGFDPPIILDRKGTTCPDTSTLGIVARSPDPAHAPPDSAFLSDVVRALASSVVADPLHGATLRFGYDRNRRASNVRISPPELEHTLDASVLQLIRFDVMSRMPALPPSLGTDTLQMEVDFGMRCELLLIAPLSDVASFQPRGDGTVRIANGPEYTALLSGAYAPHNEVLSIPVLSSFLDSVSVRLSKADTSNTNPGPPDPSAPGNALHLGAEERLGMFAWLSSTGWIRAGFRCDPDQGQSRFMEVPPAQFPRFRSTALAAIRLANVQPTWTGSADRPRTEHEVSCEAMPVGPIVLPALYGNGPAQSSIEAVVRFVVNREGRVDTTSVEFLPGADTSTRSLVVAALTTWRFRPALVGGMPVPSQTHATIVVRPLDGDAVALASAPPPAILDDTVHRTIFFKPKAPPDKPVQMTINAWDQMLQATQPYVNTARRTWPQARDRFLRGLPSGHDFFVTVRLQDPTGRREQVFVRVDRIEGGRVSGRIQSVINTVIGWRRGDACTIPENEIVDWTIVSPDGTEEGNYVGRFLDTWRPPR